MNCVILSAGEISDYDIIRQYIQEGDYIIAADGGSRHLAPLGLKCHCLLGDFDSLGYIPENADEVFPGEKDDTDTMLAIKHGLLKGMDSFVILGGLGGRLDHTLANISSLEYLKAHGACGMLADENTTVRLFGVGDQVTLLHGDGYFSVFPYGCDAAVITIEGVQYPLREGRLHSDFPLGISNRVTDRNAFAMKIHKGLVVVIECR